MAYKTLFVYSQHHYDILKSTEPNAEVILITDPEKVRIHKLTEQLFIQYDFAKDKYRKQLELAANDIIVPGFYKVIDIRGEAPRKGFPQDLPKRFIATAHWKPLDEEEGFEPEFKVDIRLNPLLNKVSESKILTYYRDKGQFLLKTMETFEGICYSGVLYVKNMCKKADTRYPIEKDGKPVIIDGVPQYQESYSVEWEVLKYPE